MSFLELRNKLYWYFIKMWRGEKIIKKKLFKRRRKNSVLLRDKKEKINKNYKKYNNNSTRCINNSIYQKKGEK